MHELAIDVENPSSSFKVIPPETREGIKSGNVGNSLNELIENKIKAKQRFYGIEISPAAKGEDLDYRKFPAQPLFTSITWLFDDNLKHESLSLAPAVQLGKVIDKCCPVLMHLTCYKLEQAKLRDLVNLGFRNVLALKGG